MAYKKSIKKKAIALSKEMSAEKIAEYFNNRVIAGKGDDIRTPTPKIIREWIRKSKDPASSISKSIQITSTESKETLFAKHFSDLIDTARFLAINIENMSRFSQYLENSTPLGWDEVGMWGNVIDGGKFGISLTDGGVDEPQGDGSGILLPVNDLLATCLLAHLKSRYPDTFFLIIGVK